MSPSVTMLAAAEEERLLAEHTSDGGADMSQPFYYLAGPMSNLPQLNFPDFIEKARILREKGYNICNPAEFDHEILRFVTEFKDEGGSHRKMAEERRKAGIPTPSWADCLRRDIEYVGHPNCEGVILLDGWEQSQGAQFETYVAAKFLKPIFKLHLNYEWMNVEVLLKQINRREALDAAGVVD